MSKVRSGPRNFFRLFLMDLLIAKSTKGGVILDAGSGDGNLCIRLAKKGYSVYAVDTDEESCNILEQRIRKLDCKEKINIFCAPLEEIRFPDGFFDIITCGEVLEHLDNDSDILKRFNGFLKKGGILILSVPLKSKGWDIWDDISGHKRLYDFDNLINILRTAGFKIEKSFSWGYPLMKLYHKFIFLKWAKRAGSEEEIREEKLKSTQLGKNIILSFVIGCLFLLDIIFTPKKIGIGMALKARKL